MKNRGYAGRRPKSFRPSLTWADISDQFAIAAATATGTATLMSMIADQSLVALTSDPPEDLTILRVVGDFTTTLTRGNWTLGLIVVDTTTSFTTFAADSDKRVLWHMTYDAETPVTVGGPPAGAAAFIWTPPNLGMLQATANQLVQVDRASVHLDISPKVKVEPGKSLLLVAWENSGAGTMTVASTDMRVLFKRSGRR